MYSKEKIILKNIYIYFKRYSGCQKLLNVFIFSHFPNNAFICIYIHNCLYRNIDLCDQWIAWCHASVMWSVHGCINMLPKKDTIQQLLNASLIFDIFAYISIWNILTFGFVSCMCIYISCFICIKKFMHIFISCQYFALKSFIFEYFQYPIKINYQ